MYKHHPTRGGIITNIQNMYIVGQCSDWKFGLIRVLRIKNFICFCSEVSLHSAFLINFGIGSVFLFPIRLKHVVMRDRSAVGIAAQ